MALYTTIAVPEDFIEACNDRGIDTDADITVAYRSYLQHYIDCATMYANESDYLDSFFEHYTIS